MPKGKKMPPIDKKRCWTLERKKASWGKDTDIISLTDRLLMYISDMLAVHKINTPHPKSDNILEIA
jgi:hypothetical protein